MGGRDLAARRPCGRDPRRRAATRAATGGPVLHTRRRRPSGDRQRGAPCARCGLRPRSLWPRVAEAGDAKAASQASNLIGVLAETELEGPTTSRGRAAFEAAVRADPANEAAAYNLELVLRRAPRRRERAKGRDRDRVRVGRRSGAPVRACPGWGTDDARALDRAARSEDARARDRGRCFLWRQALAVVVRSRSAARTLGLTPAPLARIARAARGGRPRMRGWRGRGRPARARDDRGAQAADGLGSRVRRGRLPLDARRLQCRGPDAARPGAGGRSLAPRVGRGRSGRAHRAHGPRAAVRVSDRRPARVRRTCSRGA